MNGLQALITKLKTDHSEWEIGLSEGPWPDQQQNSQGHEGGRKKWHSATCKLVWQGKKKKKNELRDTFNCLMQSGLLNGKGWKEVWRIMSSQMSMYTW